MKAEPKEKEESTKMKIGKFKMSKKAVSPVIATLLMIAIAVAASIIVYVWSMGLLGGLMQSGGGSQTAEQLILEAYDGQTGLVIRNTGTRDVNVTACYVDGSSDTSACPKTGTVVPKGDSIDFALGAAPSPGSHVLKFVSNDGGIFTFTIVGGQASMIAPSILEVKKLIA
jgi:flagellin-like protein